jgi:hypothetical protein
VRRSQGAYVGRIDQDTLVCREFYECFLSGARTPQGSPERSIFFSNRRSIPLRFAERCPELGHLERFVDLYGRRLDVWAYNGHYPDLFWTSFVGISLYHRDLWFEAGGYDERFIYYDWMETDMIARLRGRYPIVNLGELVDHVFFHLDHYLLRSVWRELAHPRQFSAAKANPEVDLGLPASDPHPNGVDWGLNDHDLEVATVGPRAEARRTALVGFVALSGRAAALSLWDRLRAWPLRRLVPAYHHWARRFRSARSTVRGQPLLRWPALLGRLWVEGRARGRERESRSST